MSVEREKFVYVFTKITPFSRNHSHWIFTEMVKAGVFEETKLPQMDDTVGLDFDSPEGIKHRNEYRKEI